MQRAIVGIRHTTHAAPTKLATRLEPLARRIER
jgi:hypothetical protein